MRGPEGRAAKAHEVPAFARGGITVTAMTGLAGSSEFADACAFLCSAQAGFISGQNLQLDGGSYEGLI